jgi:hypothetical protein
MRFQSICGSFLFLVVIFSVPPLYGQESFFPQLPGWKITQDDPVYNANNLWDAIDGAADLYLEYAFVDLHIARYISTDSIEVKAELYRHASSEDAFGMYAQERDTGYNFIRLGVQGYLQQGVLNFLTGSYYIKLSTYQTGSKAQEAILNIGKKLAEHLKQNNTMPKLFQVFPVERRIPHTEQYVARNFLGYSFLNSAYVAAYKDSSAFKIFVIEAAAPEKANAILADYLKVLPKDAVSRLDTRKYQIQDPHIGVMGVQVTNRFVYGVLNCSDRSTRDRVLKEMTASLLRFDRK